MRNEYPRSGYSFLLGSHEKCTCKELEIFFRSLKTPAASAGYVFLVLAIQQAFNLLPSMDEDTEGCGQPCLNCVAGKVARSRTAGWGQLVVLSLLSVIYFTWPWWNSQS